MENKRQQMVDTIRLEYGFDDLRVLDVLSVVPREKFVPQRNVQSAYSDNPIDIGFGQTISQPYTVAFMTHLLLDILDRKSRARMSKEGSKVLEIGTGSGYQAAVLSYFFDKVFTIEIIPQLAERAKRKLNKLGYKNIELKTASGEWGWKQKAPFDAIVITAGVEKVPEELFKQLRLGGVLIAPVGEGEEKVLTRFTKLKRNTNKELKKEEFGKFFFVPFVET